MFSKLTTNIINTIYKQLFYSLFFKTLIFVLLLKIVFTHVEIIPLLPEFSDSVYTIVQFRATSFSGLLFCFFSIIALGTRLSFVTIPIIRQSAITGEMETVWNNFCICKKSLKIPLTDIISSI